MQRRHWNLLVRCIATAPSTSPYLLPPPPRPSTGKSASTRALYKAHIAALTSHVNPLTGVALRDDPAIMGWDFLNEPRCAGREGGREEVVRGGLERISLRTGLCPRVGEGEGSVSLHRVNNRRRGMRGQMEPRLLHRYRCSSMLSTPPPRCPGCLDGDSQAAHLSWVSEMASAVKAAAPSQLVFSGTEGFFDQGSGALHRAGAGGRPPEAMLLNAQ